MDYDLAVIGGGAAGLVSAGVGAALGAKVALIEEKRLGGECTWTGCVPSKTLLRAAKLAQEMRVADRYGLSAIEPRIDYAGLVRHIREIQERIYEESDSPEVNQRRGVEVIRARAKFTDPHTLALSDGNRVTARRFVIAAGSHPLVPKIEGIEQISYLTNENIFDLEQLPRRLIVAGAGPIGIEMAQAFRRLGSEVVVVNRGHRVLSRDDQELSYLLEDALRAEGIAFELGATIEKVEPGIRVTLSSGKVLEGDQILFAQGRRVDVAALQLKAAKVEVSEYGVTINERCQTTAKHIYACGDVTGKLQFTHMAEAMAKVAVMNALLWFPKKLDTGRVPWCTFCDPELASVGELEDVLKKREAKFETYRFPFAKIDRAVTDGAGRGLIKVFAEKKSGKILGASILGVNAGEMIAEYALAMKNGLSMQNISDTIHPYPTYMLGARQAADEWVLGRLTPRLLWVLRVVFGLRGGVRGERA